MLRREFLSASTLSLGITVPGLGSARDIPSVKSILDYGARPDGKALCTKQIQRAIDEASHAGGGLVYAPPGNFLVGGLELKSRVTLYLEAGCVLLGSTSIADFDYRPGPAMWGDANGHHLIFARNADDIALCGLGTIDGQGQAYWKNIHRPTVPPQDYWKDVVTYDYAPINNHRPSPLIEFAMCRNVRISGITIKNAPGWTLRPIACETVIIDGIRIRNPPIGPNSDGIDITASRNVLVSNCDISAGDDVICIKSENPYGDLLPTKNITVTNCVITTTCNGFKLGTATHGAFENIVFSNSVIYSDDSTPLNARVIGGINVEMVDGGSVDGVLVSNIRMQNVRTPIFVRLGQRTKAAETFVRNVLIDAVDACGAVVTSSITGVPGLRPHDITVSNCRIRSVTEGKTEWAHRDIPELIQSYPESRMFGRLPAYGFYVRHADRVRLRDIEFIADHPDERPAIVCDDVEDVILRNLDVSSPVGDAPLFDLHNSRRVSVTGIRTPAAAKTFVQVRGVQSADIALFGNSLASGQRPVQYADGATDRSTTIS
ncbi:MAG TPA: glycosyl hydrolase family 28 protein [Edaphobacter sp.]|nr:glycosyl hydrolase family 28 protein [Edaphobacter sp.]